MISRRTFLRASLVAGAAAIPVGASWKLYTSDHTGDITLEEFSLTVLNLPKSFSGYTIGFLTDIHLGMWLPDEWLVRALEILASRKVDLLVLGGDYLFLNDSDLWRAFGVIRNPSLAERSPRKAIPLIYSKLTSILTSYSFTDGAIAVAGNHDHWNSTSHLLSSFSAMPGIELLINQQRTITRDDQTLQIFGVDDFLTGIPSPPPRNTLREGLDTRIIISHNPDYISAILASEPDYHFDLALCGHTHGGQIRLPGLGAVMSQIRDDRFVSGLVTIGRKQVYTSRGLGVVGLPMRYNCPPEVTVFRLVAA